MNFVFEQGETYVRRCYIHCYSITLPLIDAFTIPKTTAGYYAIKFMAAACNPQDKEAYMYMEVDQVRQSIIEKCLSNIGATQISVESFSATKPGEGPLFERESANALASVLEFAERPGFILHKRGRPSAVPNTKPDAASVADMLQEEEDLIVQERIIQEHPDDFGQPSAHASIKKRPRLEGEAAGPTVEQLMMDAGLLRDENEKLKKENTKLEREKIVLQTKIEINTIHQEDALRKDATHHREMREFEQYNYDNAIQKMKADEAKRELHLKEVAAEREQRYEENKTQWAAERTTLQAHVETWHAKAVELEQKLAHVDTNHLIADNTRLTAENAGMQERVNKVEVRLLFSQFIRC